MQALVTGVVEDGNPLGSGGAMDILQKGIRWGAAGLWTYYRRESAGERRGYGHTTEGNPLGSGGVVEIPQKGIRWGAAGLSEYHKRESAGERRGRTLKGDGGSAGTARCRSARWTSCRLSSREWGWRWLGSLNGLTPWCERGEQRGRL